LKTGVDKLTQETIESYSQEALHLLKQIPVDEDKKIPLRNLVNEMLDRDY
jgi:geranylgeranyl pyrophosphate synthase